MTIEDIQQLIKLVAKKDLSEFKYSNGEIKLHIRGKSYSKSSGVSAQPPSIINVPSAAPTYAAMPAPVAAAAVQQDPAPAAAPKAEKKADDEGNYLTVKSPMIGTFYRSSSPDKDAYVKVGDSITKGDTVCVVEAMKLFNEIESEISGKIVKVLVEDAQPIEYDQPLFLVDPS
ncbi:acetyl-CoA carboxylase biotin carboxyl carrier protein [Neolewinella antarctica]|uniref:Biotin carboxyl carrier protein of acetyl-CoA carboxylase n=1 Tax=Neolewinella antarctica TaxID=442734 RepID=A0ABX0XE88_9BACT|nr:acetyl-CoA carboxylase biotin carboxyl carrier protein [Neolewinella antarctica]NJC27231.1 acetyl-CoA carboxylase biotin carboxyl carrier protein [Neolewinella antarctica]